MQKMMHENIIGQHGLKEFCKTGCLSKAQAESLNSAARSGLSDPLMLSDQEGAGPIQALEREFAALCGAPYAVAVSSGTAAIHAALLSLDVGPGDEVITTPYTWPSTVAPIYHVGATPIFADIDPETVMLDPNEVERRITSRTKGILTVHIFGQTEGAGALCEIAKRHGLWVVGDAAQVAPNCLSAGELVKNEDAVCFSLGRGKPVSAGEGGVLVTRNPDLLRKAASWTQHPDRLLRQFGSRRQPAPWSLNYRMHPLAAVLALADISGLQAKMNHRREIYRAFWEGLCKNGAILPSPFLDKREIVPYGIPATLTSMDGARWPAILVKAFESGIPLRHGPVGSPLHVWSGEKLEKYPNAAMRCAEMELWILSSIDMDYLEAYTSFSLGDSLAKILSNQSRA
jgi:dTDP-4-amino-4,6-dideoxygalactose transaminase